MLGHHQLVSYVEDYLECVETLPLDIQRNVTLLREIDTKYQEVLQEVDELYGRYQQEVEAGQRRRLQVQLQRALISSQELGDEKIHVVTQMMEVVENRWRQMEAHSPCFSDPGEAEPDPAGPAPNAPPERASARRPRRQRNSESLEDPSEDPPPAPPPPPPQPPPREKKSKSAKKKKRSRAKQEREASPVDFSIDPDEPTYCLCQQVSYGEMIGCDNQQCPIEWFHFSCVALTYKPKGKWFCPKCRGDSEKTMERSARKERRSR